MAAFRLSRRWWWIVAGVLIAAGVGAGFALRKPANPEDRYRAVVVGKGAVSQLVVATEMLKATA